jgi:hypothetical protein
MARKKTRKTFYKKRSYYLELQRAIEGNVRETKERSGKRFPGKYRVKKSQTEEKNILERRFISKKKGKDKKVKEL